MECKHEIFFEPSWVSVLDKSTQYWISKYTCPDWMFVGRKPHPFGNERYTIACGLSTIIYFAEIVEWRYLHCERGRLEFDENVKTVGTMLRCTRPIWNFSKVVIMDSGFYVIKGLVKLWKK